MEDRASSGRPWTAVLAAMAVSAAVFQAVQGARDLNPDGVAYLDMAQRIAAGQVGDALIGYWNPLLPAVIASLLRAVPVRPPGDVWLGYARFWGRPCWPPRVSARSCVDSTRVQGRSIGSVAPSDWRRGRPSAGPSSASSG